MCFLVGSAGLDFGLMKQERANLSCHAISFLKDNQCVLLGQVLEICKLHLYTVTGLKAFCDRENPFLNHDSSNRGLF